MNANSKSLSIVVADDDPDDELMIREAFKECRLESTVDFVSDGVELLDYLHRRGDYAYLKGQVLPGIILLDLNMPRKDGREAIEEIKADPDLRRTPIVVLTTSSAEADILRTYELGVASFICKPVSFVALTEAMETLTDYWVQTVTLPVTVK